MGSTKLASTVFFACCACLACGGKGGHDSASNSDATSGSAGAPAAAGNTNSGGSGNDAGSTNSGGGGANHAGSGDSGGATNHGGNASTGQGASSGNGGGSTLDEYKGPGTVSAPWSGFCVATFTADYAVTDAFKKPMFTAHVGEQYLVVRFFVEFSADLAYLTPRGPIEFDVDVNLGEALPFTSSCGPNSTATYFAVFADVSMFAESGLQNKLCDLAGGTTVARDLSKIVGYSLETQSDLGFIYEIELNAFSARCGGADKGYIRVPAITALGSAQVIVPFRLILGQQ
jgi:hypothetical protein